MSKIDIKLLPPTAMVDTGVFMRGVLAHRPDDPESPLCKAFCDAMIDAGRQLFVSAPTIAEITRHQGQRVPRVQGISVVPFDERAAEFLGLHLPMTKLHEAKDATGVSMPYFKYDSMILACALRSRAPVIVTLDGGHHTLAKATTLKVEHPKSYELTMSQITMEHLWKPVAQQAKPTSE